MARTRITHSRYRSAAGPSPIASALSWLDLAQRFARNIEAVSHVLEPLVVLLFLLLERIRIARLARIENFIVQLAASIRRRLGDRAGSDRERRPRCGFRCARDRSSRVCRSCRRFPTREPRRAPEATFRLASRSCSSSFWSCLRTASAALSVASTECSSRPAEPEEWSSDVSGVALTNGISRKMQNSSVSTSMSGMKNRVTLRWGIWIMGQAPEPLAA